MATYQEYKSRSNGNAYDIDGSFGAQCWDGYADYCKYLGLPYANCTNTGYARDIWEQRHENGILNYFDEVEVMQAGDVAIFMVVDGVTPYSHVAIFDSDAGGGYGWFLGQNQGGANGAYNIVKIPYSATYPTAFRPKVFKNAVTVTGNIGLNKGDYFIDVSAYQQADLTTTCQQAGTTKTIGSLNGGSTPPKPNTKKVKVLKHATNWSPSSKGAKMASFVKGGTFEVKQQRPISYSYSNQEYLIVNKGTVLGWVLSQDIEGGYGSDRVGGSKPKLPAGFTKEEATFINGNAPITTRKNKPSLSSQTATPLYPGQSVRYLGWKSAEGYIWIYATDGRYIPVRPVGKEAWGTFK
nr:ClyV [synthetic construct]